MARKAFFWAVALLTFSLWSSTRGLPPLPAAGLQLSLSLLLAIAASGEASAIAIAAGAAGGLLSSVFLPLSPALAGAALLGGAFLERTLRVQRGRPRALHLLWAMGAGAAALQLIHGLRASAFEMQAVAFVMAAAMVSLPLLLKAEDSIAHLLALAAEQAHDELRTSLEQAASLRRWVSQRALRAAERRSWEELAEQVRQRVALGVATVAPPPESFRDEPAPPPPVNPEQDAVRKLDASICSAIDALLQAHARALPPAIQPRPLLTPGGVVSRKPRRPAAKKAPPAGSTRPGDRAAP